MRIFVSSLVGGMQDFRAAARRAIEQLGHEPVMVEDFPARPSSPQVACPQDARRADAVVLILGAEYGARQESGLSATHEEYRETRDRGHVFAFVQQGVTRTNEQQRFVDEVGPWNGGLFRKTFSTPEDLQGEIVRAIHQWELSRARVPLDEKELLGRAVALIPKDRYGCAVQGPAVALSLAFGPSQSILRPSDLERADFQEDLERAAMYGPTAVMDRRKGVECAIREDRLVLEQEHSALIALDAQGDVLIHVQLRNDGFGMVLIEEDIKDILSRGFGYAAWLVRKIDPSERLTHFVAVAALTAVDHLTMRTRAQQAASPNRYPMRSREEAPIVYLKPSHRVRASLANEADNLIEDLIVLLRRKLAP